MLKNKPSPSPSISHKKRQSTGVNSKQSFQIGRPPPLLKQPIHLGLILNGLSAGIGCAVFALSLVYILGVIGTQEPKFDDITCDNLTLNFTPNLKPDFVVKWQCNYFDLEFCAGSVAAIAGLLQTLFCLIVLLTNQISWRVWMIPHCLVVVVLTIPIILLFYVFTTMFQSQRLGLRGTNDFWNEHSPHMGITNAEPVVITFLVLFYGAWLCLDLIFCIGAVYIANENRRKISQKRVRLKQAEINEDEETAPTMAAINKSFTESDRNSRENGKTSTTKKRESTPKNKEGMGADEKAKTTGGVLEKLSRRGRGQKQLQNSRNRLARYKSSTSLLSEGKAVRKRKSKIAVKSKQETSLLPEEVKQNSETGPVIASRKA